jgi:hypothetical protein
MLMKSNRSSIRQRRSALAGGYNIYRVRPRDELLRSGQAETKDAAERAGKRALAEVLRAEESGHSTRQKPAV